MPCRHIMMKFIMRPSTQTLCSRLIILIAITLLYRLPKYLGRYSFSINPYSLHVRLSKP